MSYDEGIAAHISPESCAGNGNIAIRGQVLLFATHDGKKQDLTPIRMAVIGVTDIAMRQYLPPDIMAKSKT